MSAFAVSIDLATFALPLKVTGTYFAGTPARTYGPVENCSEGEPEEIDIESITVTGLRESVALPLDAISDDAYEEIQARCIEEIKDEQERQEDDAAISRYEDAREEQWL